MWCVCVCVYVRACMRAVCMCTCSYLILFVFVVGRAEELVSILEHRCFSDGTTQPAGVGGESEWEECKWVSVRDVGVWVGVGVGVGMCRVSCGCRDV